MEGWKEFVLGDLCTITSSKRIFYDDYVPVGIPFYRSKEIIEKANGVEISTELFITHDKYREIKLKFGVPQKGDILLTSVGTLGIPYLVKEKDLFYFKDGNLTWLKDFTKDIISKFLLYWIKSEIGQEAIDNITIGSTQSAITIQDLKGITLSVPSLALQHRIAEILGALDDKIELNRQMNQTLEQMAQALYKHYFVDNIDPENLPEGWKINNIRNYGKVVCGKTPSKNISQYFGGIIPFIKIPDMHNNIFIIRTEDSLTEAGADSQKNKYLPAGSVCVSCIATVGLVGITTYASQTNQQINSIIPTSVIDKYYLFFTLKGLKKDLLDLGSAGTATLNVNTSLFSDIEIINPKFELKQSFHYAVEPLFGLLLNNDTEIQSLRSIRDSLLPKLISGELIPSDLQTIEQAL
jgi:type I restriction enzyme S subunit